MAKKKKQLKAAQAAMSRKKRRSRKKKRIVILALEVIVLLLLSGTAYVLAKYGKFQTITINKDDIEINDGISHEGYTTVALFGGDSREGELGEGTHADTMIVVSLDNESREIKMASVYRDTILCQGDNTYLKANNAYFVGGPKEAINMLNRNLDLDIEDYVTVDFKALVDTIDLLGGIDIDIKEEEIQPLNKYIKETAKTSGTKAHTISNAGEQHLDGTQAVTYARIRSTEGGDYTRTERQRLVIKKLFEKTVKTNLSTVNEIIDTVFPQVSTSFELKELIALASGITEYELGDNTGFPIDKTDGTYENVGSIVIPLGLEENVKKLHEFLYPKEKDYVPSQRVKDIAAEITFRTGVSAPVSGSESTENTGSSNTGDTSGAEIYGTDSYDGGTDPYGGDAYGTDIYGGDTSGGDVYGGDVYSTDPYGDGTGGDVYGGDTYGADPYGGDTTGTDSYGNTY